MRRAGGRARRPGGDEGASSIELVMYTPLLMTLTFLVIQFALAYLGNQVASGAAREGARIVRNTGADSATSCAAAKAKIQAMVSTVGRGLLTLTGEPECTITTRDAATNDRSVVVVVRGDPERVIPFIPFPIEQTVEGPIEQFRPDR